jgi:hypothetical protein
VRLHELFEGQEQWCIAMELVNGVVIVSYAREEGALTVTPAL